MRIFAFLDIHLERSWFLFASEKYVNSSSSFSPKPKFLFSVQYSSEFESIQPFFPRIDNQKMMHSS